MVMKMGRRGRKKKKIVENATTTIVQVLRLFDILDVVRLMRKAMTKLMYFSLLMTILVCYFSVFSVLLT